MSPLKGFQHIEYPWEAQLIRLQSEIGQEDGYFFIQVCGLQAAIVHTLRCGADELDNAISGIYTLQSAGMFNDEIATVTIWNKLDRENDKDPVILILPSRIVPPPKGITKVAALIPSPLTVAIVHVQRRLDRSLLTHEAFSCPLTKFFTMAKRLIDAETEYYVENQAKDRIDRKLLEEYRKYIIKGMKDVKYFKGGK